MDIKFLLFRAYATVDIATHRCAIADTTLIENEYFLRFTCNK